MDFQLTAIILIFATLLIMEQFENKESFAVIRKGYTNTSNLLTPGFTPYPSSINFKPFPPNFSNFGTFGSYPPNPLCSSCKLEEGVSAPYLHINDVGDQSGEQYGKVTTKCSSIYNKNYADLNKPFLVGARSAGRGRVCRRLI